MQKIKKVYKKPHLNANNSLLPATLRTGNFTVKIVVIQFKNLWLQFKYWAVGNRKNRFGNSSL